MTNQSQNFWFGDDTVSLTFSSLEIVACNKFQTSRFLENLDSFFFFNNTYQKTYWSSVHQIQCLSCSKEKTIQTNFDHHGNLNQELLY